MKEMYDWDMYFDGDEWVLEEGVDFPVPVLHFKQSIYHAARRRKKKVHVYKHKNKTNTVRVIAERQDNERES